MPIRRRMPSQTMDGRYPSGRESRLSSGWRPTTAAARGSAMPSKVGDGRPKLTSRALRRWVPALARHAPSLVTAYLVPGRVPPTIREAAMLGVTSVNRCQACESVHGRWAKGVGLHIDDLSPREAAAYAFGQRLATSGPHNAGPPADMSERHQRELLAVSILMELANLAGNRFLPSRSLRPTIQIGDARTARLLDLGMRAADRAGIGRARTRVAGRATGDVLEIGVGTGSNFRVYPEEVVVHGVDVSGPALSIAAERAVSSRATGDPVGGRCGRLALRGRHVRHRGRDLRPVFGRRRRPEPARGASCPAPRRDDPAPRARPVRPSHGRRAAGPDRASMGSRERRLQTRPRRARRGPKRRVDRDRGATARGGTLVEIVAA